MVRKMVSIVVVHDDKEYMDRLLNIFTKKNIDMQIIRLSPLGSLLHALNDCKKSSVIVVGYKDICENMVTIRFNNGDSPYVKRVRFDDFLVDTDLN